jgi:glycosyltransferase involved in cell wall biosynthesis
MQKYFEKSKVIFIKNIIDEADILERANKSKSKEFLKDNLTIVSIGRLATQKRFDLSIFTAKVLNENNIDFEWYIVGEGNERQHLESLIQDNHLSNKVFLLGFRDNPYPYIKDCDIYVQTSAFEGLGRTLIEASILCKPIVTTNFPTAYGLVENGKTGFVVEMFPEKIAKKIELLHLDKALYSEMVRELSKKSNNDKQIIIEKVFELFES